MSVDAIRLARLIADRVPERERLIDRYERMKDALDREHEARLEDQQLLKRYLDNHCAAADIEGMSVLCECTLCRATRARLL